MNYRKEMALLVELFQAIQANDQRYAVRYGLVLLAVAYAHSLGMPAGFRIDPEQPEWPVAFIELPQGQISWHCPQHSQSWDGHSTEEKYKRMEAWIREVTQQQETGVRSQDPA